MSLTPQQRDLLSLIKRSKPDNEGWYRVSKMLWPLIDGKMPADLVETIPTADIGGRLRLTDRGQAVADYL